MAAELALYRDGRREDCGSPAELAAACRRDGALAWVDLAEPDAAALEEVARAFALPALAVEDTAHAHQRPKLERYGDTLFLVLRPARYVDHSETVEFGEVHVFAGPSFVVTARLGELPDLTAVRAELEARPDLLARGPFAVVHAILDRVVDDYLPVAAGIENDIDELEDEVFAQTGNASRRTYELTREVIAFQRALKPLVPLLGQLTAEVDAEELAYLRDVHDHTLRLQEQVDGFRQLLDNMLRVNLTLETKALSEVANAQGEQVKRISAWAAILFAPTLVGTVYGMNFDHMPELGWLLGYPFALALMVAVSVTLYVLFRRRGWI